MSSSPVAPEKQASRDESLAALALCGIPGVGPTYAKRLIEEAGSFQDIFERTDEISQKAGLPAAFSTKIKSCRKKAFDRAMEQMRKAEERGQRVAVLTDPSYPRLLKEIPDPPPALYIYGEAPPDSIALGVVGTRKATPGGLKFARDIAFELASAGVTIVSGLAFGVDGAAHGGAMEADGGRTWAVLGCGADVVYPERHRDIYDRIRQSGAILSEFPPGTTPEKYHFPMRNRIISGLSLGVLVVEAPERSGALITAHLAVEQGREVFAVPHPARMPAGAGTNRLIREGAHLVEKVEDVLGVIEHQARLLQSTLRSTVDRRPSQVDSEIYALIEKGVCGLDELVDQSRQNVSSVLAELTRLELAGRIRRVAASTYRAAGRS